MSTGAIIGLLIAVVVVGVIAVVVTQELRRARLRRQFGPEHERLTSELGSSRKADAELLARQRRAAKLDVRQLSDEQRARYAADWAQIQEDFVDNPANTVESARGLLARMLRDSGYPDDQDETVMAISVHNRRALDDYRQAQTIGGTAGNASTEELREALLRYRTLFDNLAGGTRREVPSAAVAEANGDPERNKLTGSLTPTNREKD